jgi:hypothetical protein
MTEKIPDSSSELKEYETIREEAQYVPERDDRMGFKLISAIVILVTAAIYFYIKLS